MPQKQKHNGKPMFENATGTTPLLVQSQSRVLLTCARCNTALCQPTCSPGQLAYAARHSIAHEVWHHSTWRLTPAAAAARHCWEL